MIKKLTANARRPQGLWGNLMIKKMNRGHAAMTKWGLENIPLHTGAVVADKTTPRLIQFHTLKNAVNPPFLGGFLISGTVAA